MVTARISSCRSTLRETLCPFLYETRTIRHVHVNVHAQDAKDAAKRENAARKKDDKGFDLFRLKSHQVQGRLGRPPTSTLTSEERKVFENIRRTFGIDVGALAQPRHVSPARDTSPLMEVDTSLKASEAPIIDLYDTSVNSILSLFAPAPTTPITETHSVIDLSPTHNHSRQDAEPNAHQPYPPHLIRTAAIKALTRIAHRTQSALRPTDLQKNLLHGSPAHDHAVQQSLWDVTTNMILPLITLLRDPSFRAEGHRTPWGQQVQQLTVGDVEDMAVNPTAIASTALRGIPRETPLLPLITILYPAATLLALRTYAFHLPTSGYLLALLPKVRELGPTSYLLAGNVHFYNTILQVTWDVYSDLSGMDRLLREMRRDGVGYDEGTLQVLERVRRDREVDVVNSEISGGMMGRGRVWWGMRTHEEDFESVDSHWRAVVKKELEKKRMREKTGVDEESEDVG